MAMSITPEAPDPLVAAAERRRSSAEAAAAAAAGGDLAPSETMRRRPARQPFGSFEQRLAAPPRPGFHRHWFNDDPGRIVRAEAAGYTHVKNESGQPTSKVVGVARGGGPLTAYLMEMPEEWYAEDQAAQEAEYAKRIAAIEQGRGPGVPTTGADGSAVYVGKTGISLRSQVGSRR